MTQFSCLRSEHRDEFAHSGATQNWTVHLEALSSTVLCLLAEGREIADGFVAQQYVIGSERFRQETFVSKQIGLQYLNSAAARVSAFVSRCQLEMPRDVLVSVGTFRDAVTACCCLACSRLHREGLGARETERVVPYWSHYNMLLLGV
jgi:hypothetical protein